MCVCVCTVCMCGKRKGEHALKHMWQILKIGEFWQKVYIYTYVLIFQLLCMLKIFKI